VLATLEKEYKIDLKTIEKSW